MRIILKYILQTVSYRDRFGGHRPDLTDSRHGEGYNDKCYEPSGFLKCWNILIS